MKRFTKTTMVALAIVAGVAASSMAQKKKTVRFDPVSKDVYQLTYHTDGDSRFRVELTDGTGTKLLTKEISKSKSVIQPYNLANLKPGDYTFTVIDKEGEYETKFEIPEDGNMAAAIKKLENDRAKIIVKGDDMNPIYVNVFDRNDKLLFDDYIERERSFTRIYDLSKIQSNYIRIEVSSRQKILAEARL